MALQGIIDVELSGSSGVFGVFTPGPPASGFLWFQRGFVLKNP